MAWVETFTKKEAEGELAKVYQELQEEPMLGGRLPNILKCMGLRPDALRAVWHLNKNLTFGGSTLGRAREEMISLAVSVRNRCHY